MATKLICDRCGAEINPKSSVSYAGMRRLIPVGFFFCEFLQMGKNDNDYELCVSCVHKLRAWFSGMDGNDGG